MSPELQIDDTIRTSNSVNLLDTKIHKIWTCRQCPTVYLKDELCAHVLLLAKAEFEYV